VAKKVSKNQRARRDSNPQPSDPKSGSVRFLASAGDHHETI
jgi:hypothetical protein